MSDERDLLKLSQLSTKTFEKEQFDAIRGSFFITTPDGTEFQISASEYGGLKVSLSGAMGFIAVLPHVTNSVTLRLEDWSVRK